MPDLPTSVLFLDGASVPRVQLSTADGTGSVAPQTALRSNGAPVEAANPLPVSARNGLTMTQTVVTLTASVDAELVPANADRRSLALINIDTGDATLGFGGAGVFGTGWPLDAAASSGRGGGGRTWEVGEGPPLGSVHAISLVGTRIVVLEGV